MIEGSAGVQRAILETYARVTKALWPRLHARVAERAREWPRRSEDELRLELEGYVADLSGPHSPFGLFWKLGRNAAAGVPPRPADRLTYQGANANFVVAAGVSRLEDLLGCDDFDPRFAWGAQAARFVADDRRVMNSQELIGYIERRVVNGAESWNRVSKTAITAADGLVYGVLGMYETLDPEEGRKAYWEQVTKEDAVA